MTILARARVILEGDSARLTKSFSGAARAMEQAGRRMQTVGRTLTTRVTLPTLLVGGAAVKMAADFDGSMRKIVGLVGVNADVVDGWKDKVRELGVTYAKSAGEAADALFFITSAGLRGEAAITTLEAALKASAAGMGNVAVLADAATSAMNAYGISNITAERATEILTAAVRAGKLETETLAPVIGRLLPTASKMGVSFEQVAGILAVFSRTGLQAAEGATSLNSILSTLLKPSQQAEAALAGVGITMGDLRKMAAGPQGLVGVLRLLDSAFEGNEDALALIIPNIRALRGAMNVLAQDSVTVDKVMNDVANSVGIVDEAFEASKGPAFRLAQAWVIVKEALLDIGNVLIPVVVPALQSLTRSMKAVTQIFTDGGPAVQQFGLLLMGLMLVAGPGLLVMGGLAIGLGKVTRAMKLMLVPTQAGTRALVMMRAVISPTGLLIAGLAALAVGYMRARAEAKRVESATADANRAFEAQLRLMSPKQAGTTVTRMTELITRLKHRQRDLLVLASTEIIAANFKEGVAFRDAANRLGESISVFENHRDVLRAIAAAGKDAGEVVVPKVVIPTITIDPLLVLNDAIDGLKSSLLGVQRMSALLGSSFDLAGEQAQALEAGVQDLIMAGAEFDAVVGPNGETVRQLAQEYIKLQQSIARTEKAQAALTAAQQDADQVIQSIQTPTQAYGAILLRLQQHLLFGRINQEQFNLAVEQAQQALAKATGQGSKWGKVMEQVTQKAARSFAAFTSSVVMPSAAAEEYKMQMEKLQLQLDLGRISQREFNLEVLKLKDAADEARVSFSEFIGQLISDLRRLATEQLILSFLKNIGKASGGVEEFATGGFLGGRQIGLVGESGPELVMAGRAGLSINPMKLAVGEGGGGGGANVSVTIQAMDAISFIEFAERNEGALVAPVVKALSRSAILQGAMQR